MFAWVGASLFAGALVYFLFTYAVTFGEIAVGPTSAAAIAADVALFSAFALHHSIFARERVRAWVGRTLSPRKERREGVPADTVERSVYVWVASLMLIAVCALWQPVPGVAWNVSGPAAWALRGVQLFGVWLTLRGAAVIDIWDLAGVRQAQGGPSGPPAEFKTEGPYGWVRHPIYLGWFLVVFAMPLMTMTRLLFAVVSGVYIVIAIPFEERSLVRASGGAYEGYIGKVRWKLVPGLH